MRALWQEDSLSFDGKYRTVPRRLTRDPRVHPDWFGGGAPAFLIVVLAWGWLTRAE